jgi:DNA-binding PadR family transcriptional regulator
VGTRFDRDRDSAGLGTPVYWAVLGLIIERPSYGYELVQRLERTYGDLLTLSSASQIYKALDTLTGKGLIEQLPEPNETRQPKPHYRATAAGVRVYEERLIAQVAEDGRRSRVFALELAVLPPQAALTVLDGYEQACLEHASREAPCVRAGTDDGDSDKTGLAAEDRHGGTTGSAARGRRGGGRAGTLADRLAAEETRLTSQARLPWIEYARRELTALLEERAGRQ